jgi:hypothetical protein
MLCWMLLPSKLEAFVIQQIIKLDIRMLMQELADPGDHLR